MGTVFHCSDRERLVFRRLMAEVNRQKDMENPDDPMFWSALFAKLSGDFATAAFEKSHHSLPGGRPFRSLTEDAIQLGATALSFLLTHCPVPDSGQFEADVTHPV